MTRPLRIVFLGLSLSSSWGNGHATTYRALLRALDRRGHDLLFLEREQPWYADNRDHDTPDYCELRFYADLAGLRAERRALVEADAVVMGSYVPEGPAVAALIQRTATGVTAFYDIDTPVTLAKLEKGDFEYITPAAIRGFDLYLSFTSGPALRTLERRYGARSAHALYCSVDTDAYRPARRPRRYLLGYLGTYSADRQPGLEALLLAPARRMPKERFIVAGPLYPSDISWPANVERVDHIPPSGHAAFYQSCRFTLNLTRRDMVQLGYSPSVRLFEAAASGTPIVSDIWNGLDTLFVPGREILLAPDTDAVCRILTSTGDRQRRAIARRARDRILAEHTSAHRAKELERLLLDARTRRDTPRRVRETAAALA